MNKAMRRKNKERKDVTFLDNVLTKADDIYVAFTSESPNEAPYVLPLNFAYIDGKIYIHCALEGRKMDCIRNNPKVGFSTSTGVKIIPEEATTHYQSVVGTGNAHIVDDPQEKGLALDAIASRFKAECEMPASAKNIARTAIIRINIEEWCGKQSPPPSAE